MNVAGAYGLSRSDLPRPSRPTTRTRPGAIYHDCALLPDYSMVRIDLASGASEWLHFYQVRRGTYLVESGEVLFCTLHQDGSRALFHAQPGAVVSVLAGEVHAFRAESAAVLYFFASGCIEDDSRWVCPTEAYWAGRTCPVEGRPADYRPKYWGDIATVVSGEFAGKRIFTQREGQSSLEFHCHKRETYYVHSGLVRAGLRVGRGENCSLIIPAGESLTIEPGLLHMRIGVEDSVIMEISTRDDDRDSHLVEDGRTYRHIDAPATMSH